MNAAPRRRQSFFMVRLPIRGEFSTLIVDANGRAHRPLSWFLPYLSRQYARETVRAYAYSLIHYFTWLEYGDKQWNESHQVVRAHCEQYLNSVLCCKTREHRSGKILISLTQSNGSEVGIFLSAIRSFYRFARANNLYSGPHPLDQKREQEDSSCAQAQSPPSMPMCSGVQEPGKSKTRKRLTETYFVVVNDRWIPHLIDDREFPKHLTDAGIRAGWKLRERIVSRLLFETGARVSEICGLTLGDWSSRGLRCEASAFSKGSHRRRVKVIRFTETSAKLLREYFDYERRAWDANHWRLSDYLNKMTQEELLAVPIFLTRQSAALPSGTFRDLYWRPACVAANLKANIHQARHWYVTFAMRQIFEETAPGFEREQKIQDLIIYMAWRRGQVTLASYNHYFATLMPRYRHDERWRASCLKIRGRAKLYALVRMPNNEFGELFRAIS
jgi:site-specific recombinase XerD